MRDSLGAMPDNRASFTSMSASWRILVILPGLGLVGSTVWNLLTLLNHELSKSLWMTLTIGIFPLWFIAILTTFPLRDRIRDEPKKMWSIVLEAAPTWMCLLPLYIGVYAWVNFFLTTGQLFGSISSPDEHFQRAASGIDMVFYAAAMAMLYSAGARDNAIRCPEGHIIYPGQKTCPVCGQPPSRSEPALRHGA